MRRMGRSCHGGVRMWHPKEAWHAGQVPGHVTLKAGSRTKQERFPTSAGAQDVADVTGVRSLPVPPEI